MGSGGKLRSWRMITLYYPPNFGVEGARFRVMARQPASAEVAVVTGAARGIGFAIATALAHRGAKVCLLDLSRQALDTAAERLAAAVPAAQVMVHAVDVADENGVAAAVAAVSRRWGRVDVLVQAAGAPRSTHPRLGVPRRPFTPPRVLS